LIIPPEDLVVGGIYYYGLDRSRANVKADHETHALIQPRCNRFHHRRRRRYNRLRETCQWDKCAAGVAGASSSAASARAAHYSPQT
jgi:hypothetical protein